MHHRPLADEFPAILPTPESIPQRITPCDPAALQRLTKAFDAARPAAILIGPGRARSSQVIDTFLAGLDENTCVARFQTPCKSASAYMRAIVRAIGFEPKDFCVSDLDKILLMFLCHQRTHGQRTVICIEDAQDCDSWVLSNVCELADMEAQQRYGLFVIVSGRHSLRECLYQQPLQRMVGRAGRHIPVSPLALAETREFVLQQIPTEGTDDVGELIKFEAITRLHEIGAGDPDTVSGLYAKSLQLAEQESGFPITPRSVSRAACTLGLVPYTLSDDDEHTHTGSNRQQNDSRLIVRVGDKAFGERALDRDNIAIGRDLRNDLSIPSLTVSRHHVLLVTSSSGVKLVDLGSTNGTFVNGSRINSHVLKNGDAIRLGDCQLEYVAAD